MVQNQNFENETDYKMLSKEKTENIIYYNERTKYYKMQFSNETLFKMQSENLMIDLKVGIDKFLKSMEIHLKYDERKQPMPKYEQYQEISESEFKKTLRAFLEKFNVAL